MSLETRLADLATAVGEDVKDLRRNRVVVSDNIADLPEEGLLIQTGLGQDGSGYTLWFNDGKP